MRARSIWLAALAAAGCASPEAPPERTVLMQSASGAVLVVPLNVTRDLPDSLAADAPELWEALGGDRAAQGARRKTVAFDSARRLWLESAREARASSDHASFADAARLFVGRLAAHGAFEHVLVPSLFVQGAPVTGRTASWDGASREVAIDEGVWSGHLGDDPDFGGAVPAASLHVAVLDAGGRLVHEKQAGLVLLARVRLTGRPELGTPGFEADPVERPFADREATLRGIARALDPWLTPLDPASVGR